MAAKQDHITTLGSFCPKITRGIQLDKRQIIECLTAVPTGYRYLTLAELDKSLSLMLDIDDLPYFDPTPLGKSVEQFCLKKNMILLSKNDTPYKIDFVGDIGDEKIIASGNIYMITVDEEKIPPECLYFWLKSKEGMLMLRNASSFTNGNMRWISIKQLNEMLLPEFTIDEQQALLDSKIEEVNYTMTSVLKQVEDLAKTLQVLKELVTEKLEKHNEE
ncbi:MAG: hypothetical protein E7478_08535 [Ruminococcaceae bacterium]|nr:hypothetical protein [Oscillospiraceae bacterium]